MALGDYQPEGLFPQEADPKLDGGQPEVHPVFVSETPVLVDHHALFLDIITMGVQTMPPRRKYAIRNLRKEDWEERNGQLKQNPKYQRLAWLGDSDYDVQQQCSQLIGPLKEIFKDRYRTTREDDDWEAEGRFERQHAQRELYREAKEKHQEQEKTRIVNEMRRTD